MNEHELEQFILNYLANHPDAWISFEDLDKLLANEAPEWSETIRRSYLRGEVGRMLRSGQIKRKKTSAEYQLSDDVNLF